MGRSYSVTHYYCGCHIVENRPDNINFEESIFCEDTEVENSYMDLHCAYLPVPENS